MKTFLNSIIITLIVSKISLSRTNLISLRTVEIISIIPLHIWWKIHIILIQLHEQQVVKYASGSMRESKCEESEKISKNCSKY